MSLTTLVFVVILAFFTWRGYQKGFVGAITKVLSFIVAYPAAIFFTKPFAHILRAYTGLDGLILFLVSGCTIFLVASLLVTLLLNYLASLTPANNYTETGSKIGGVAFGIIFGSVVGLIAVYVLGIVLKPNAPPQQVAIKSAQQKSDARQQEEADSIKKYVVAEGKPTNNSFIDITAKKLVSTAASTAVGIITSDKTTTQITKTITQDPQATLNHVQNMTNDGEFKQLLDKPAFQAELNRGDVASLMENKDFQALMQNPDMQAIIATDENAGDKSSERAAAEKMIQAWQKVETLKNNPRVLDIVQDPAFQAQLNSPNKLSLLMNPKMRELSEIIFNSDPNPIASNNSAETTAGKNANHTTSKTHYVVEDITEGNKPASANKNDQVDDDKNAEEKHEEKLYRWTDEAGKVHYSDKPIKH